MKEEKRFNFLCKFSQHIYRCKIDPSCKLIYYEEYEYGKKYMITGLFFEYEPCIFRIYKNGDGEWVTYGKQHIIDISHDAWKSFPIHEEKEIVNKIDKMLVFI